MAVQSNIAVLLGLSIMGLIFLRRKKKPIPEDFGAFVDRLEIPAPPPRLPPRPPWPLAGLKFAVKDMFDIQGRIASYGSPLWKATHDPATSTAPTVAALVSQGAQCVGQTHLVQMAFSITGENKLYGTPFNPACPDRVPGGSSSGSAVAVAGKLVDFALGTDTGGSVRIPAAFCGILGFRPSHGAISTKGVVPLAPSFDTVGWFARDPAVLRSVGRVLLLPANTSAVAPPRTPPPKKLLIATDLFDMCEYKEQMVEAVQAAVKAVFPGVSVSTVKVGEYLAASVPGLKKFAPAGEKDPGVAAVVAVRDAAAKLQFYQFRQNHEAWLTDNPQRELDEEIEARVQVALKAEPAPAVEELQPQLRAAMARLMQGNAVLALPTSHAPPPKRGAKAAELDAFRARAFTLLSLAGMPGCPQVAAPLGTYKGLPVSVSLMAPFGEDLFLLDVVAALAGRLMECGTEALEKGRGGAKGGKAAQNGGLSAEERAEEAKEKGNTAFRQGNYKEAIRCYSDGIKLSGGKSAVYYGNRAMAYLKADEFGKAEEDCTRALAIDRRMVKVYLRRGRAREFLGDFRGAWQDYETALVYEPQNVDAKSRLDELKRGGYTG